MVCFTIHVAKGQTTVTIGNGTSTDYSNPFETYFNYGWSSQLYLKSEIGAAGSISAIGYYVSNSGPSYTLDNQKIYVRHSSLASFADKYYPTTTGFTLVYSGSITFGASGWKTVVFNTPFAYNGVDNLEIMVESRDGSTFTSAIQSRYTSQAGGSIYRTKYDYNDYSFPTTYQAGGRVQHYSNVQFTINTCTYTGGTASASASTVCSGGSSTLTLTGNSGTPIQWQSSTDNITFTDVLGATSTSYAASILTASKYYRAKIGSGSCVVYSTSTLVTVNSNPTADAGSALTAICQSTTSSAMGGSIGGGATSGTWSGGAGTWTNATNASTATYTANATETGTITLTLTTSGGNCGTTTATKTLIINSNPTQNTTTPSNVNICRGETVLFTSSTLGSNETIQWQESSDNATFTNLSGETNLTYRAENITSSKYIRSVVSLGTCSYTGISHTITVLSSPTSLTLTAGKVSIASGESSTLTASGATNYTWDHNLGNGASVSVSPTGTTTYTVTGNNGNSCTETATITITVNSTTSSINTVQVGTLGNGTDYSNPFQTYFNFGWSTQLYLASELNKTGKITSLAYYVNNSGGSYTLDNQKVYVRHTALSSYTDNLHPGNSGFTLVYEGSITFGASGWNTIPFSTAFDYNGTDNLEVLIESRDASTFTSAIQTRYTNQSGTSIYRTKYYYDNDNFPSLTASGLKIHHFSTAQFTINTCTITAGTVTANVSSVCSGGNVTLQVNNQTAGQNIQWQFSSDDVTYTDISNQTASTYNATNVASAGYYRVKIGSAACVVKSAGVNVGVNIIPSEPIITIDTLLCKGEPLQLFALSNVGATYLWNGPNNYESSLQNPMVSVNAMPSLNGTYSVMAILNGCKSRTSSSIVEVKETPILNLTADLEVALRNQEIHYSISNLLNGLPIQWQKSDNNVEYLNVSGTTASTLILQMPSIPKLYLRAAITFQNCTNYSNVVVVSLDSIVNTDSIYVTDRQLNNSRGSLDRAIKRALISANEGNNVFLLFKITPDEHNNSLYYVNEPLPLINNILGEISFKKAYNSEYDQGIEFGPYYSDANLLYDFWGRATVYLDGFSTKTKITKANQYYALKRKIDATHYKVDERLNILPLMYDNQYAKSVCSYKIYSQNRSIVQSGTIIMDRGKNNFVVNLDFLGLTGVYTYEIVNTKGDVNFCKFYLKRNYIYADEFSQDRQPWFNPNLNYE